MFCAHCSVTVMKEIGQLSKTNSAAVRTFVCISFLVLVVGCIFAKESNNDLYNYNNFLTCIKISILPTWTYMHKNKLF